MFIIPSIGNGFVDGLRQAREDNWDDAQQEQNLRIRNALADKSEATLGSDISRINAQNSYLTNEYGRNDAMNAGTFDSRLANINATNWLGADKSNRENQLGAALFPGQLATNNYTSYAQQAQAQANLQAGVPQSLAASSVGANLAKGATEYNSARASALAGLTDSDVAILVNPSTFAGNPQSATAEYAKRGIINPYNESVGYERNQKDELTPVIYTFNANGDVVSKRAAIDHIVEGRQAGIVAATPPSVRSQEIRNQGKAGTDITNNILSGTAVGSSNGTAAVTKIPTATSAAAASSNSSTSGSSTETPANVDTMTTGSTTPMSNTNTSTVDKSKLIDVGPFDNSKAKQFTSDLIDTGNWNPSNAASLDKNAILTPISYNGASTKNGVIVPPIAAGAANTPRYVEVIHANGGSSYVPARTVVDQTGRPLSYLPDNMVLSGDAAPHSYQTAAGVQKVYTPFVDNAPEYSYSFNDFNQSGKDTNTANTGLAYAGTNIAQPVPEKQSEQSNNSTSETEQPAPYVSPYMEDNREYLLGLAKTDPTGVTLWSTFMRMPYIPGYTERLKDELYATASNAIKQKAANAIQYGHFFGLYHPDPIKEKEDAKKDLNILSTNLNSVVAQGQLGTYLQGPVTEKDLPQINDLINKYGESTVKMYRPDLYRQKVVHDLFGEQ